MERETMVQRHAHGMSGILLIGTDGGKRRYYFERAAADKGILVTFLDWKDIPGLGIWAGGEENGYPGWNRKLDPDSLTGSHVEAGSQEYFGFKELEQYVVKIDAPQWDSCCLADLEELADQYGEWLGRLSQLPAGAFLNHPLAIREVLHKRRCKERLIQNKIPATEMYGEHFSCGEELLTFLKENRISQVFVKPVKGSGAAGVTALRFSPGSGRIALYTCAAAERGQLFNTKRMYRLEGKEGCTFLDSLLKLDCVVERWYGKASFKGYCYDLRVIAQGGQIDYILPRLSKGPITNLHLNNHSMDFEDLCLGKETREQIFETCLKAAACYPGLRSIGMDVLLEQGSLKPRIIEMNAQGDLLHRDVYGENRIYRRQIEVCKELLSSLPGSRKGCVER